MSVSLQGVGMTSLRTRERMIKRLADQGIQNQKLLEIAAGDIFLPLWLLVLMCRGDVSRRHLGAGAKEIILHLFG